MKIAPMPSAANTVTAPSGAQEMRTMKMVTQVTPAYIPPPSVAQELPKPDANGDPAVAPAAQVEPLSPQQAEIARRTRALQVKERALADKEKALAAELATKSEFIDPARLKTETLRVLKEQGITYEDLKNAILANPVNPELQALEAKVQALETGVDEKIAQRDAQIRAQVKADLGRQAQGLAAEGEQFELIRETQSVPKVIELVERIFDTEGIQIPLSEAMQMVEDELVKDGLKLAGLQKVRGQLTPQPAPVAAAPQQRPAMRTLTNQDTATPPLNRRDRAIAAFNGTLKR